MRLISRLSYLGRAVTGPAILKLDVPISPYAKHNTRPGMLGHRVDGQQAKKQPGDGQRFFLDYVEVEFQARTGLFFSIDAVT